MGRTLTTFTQLVQAGDCVLVAVTRIERVTRGL